MCFCGFDDAVLGDPPSAMAEALEKLMGRHETTDNGQEKVKDSELSDFLAEL